MSNQLVQFSGNNEDLFVRLSVDHLKAGAELVVPETHFALMIRDGVCVEALSAGRYDIFDTKHGLFREVKARDESVDVIFISKTVRIRMKWGTPTQLHLRDPETDVPLKLGMSGEVEFKVKVPKKFYLEIVGSEEKYNVSELKTRILARFVGVIETAVIAVMKSKKYSYTEFDAHKTEISKELGANLNTFFEDEYGLTLYSFTVLNYVIPPEDMLTLERARRVLKSNGELENLCIACGKEVSPSAAFCPYCGASQKDRACKKCGAENPPDAKFCCECGERLR